MKILKFDEFKNENFLHSGIWTINTNIILSDEFNLTDFSEKNIKNINKFLNTNKNKNIRLYHGTHPNIPILEEGILTTKLKTKKSYQSQVGFVYLSLYPESAKLFGNIGYGINNATVYQVDIPILYLKPDLDQLHNSNTLNKTLGDSAIHGHGFRVKGDVPPYMITKTNL